MIYHLHSFSLTSNNCDVNFSILKVWAHWLLYWKSLLLIIPCNSPSTLCRRHGGMSFWRGVWDTRPSCGIQEADRQTAELLLGRQPTAGLIHAGVPVWCIHTHKHTYSFFLSCTIKQNTFFFLCVSMNIKTRRHFPQAGYCEIYMAAKKHLDTLARLQNVCISLYYINIKPRAFF